MDRKTKIIAVLAAGALAILVGSSVARCTLAQDGGEAGPDPVSQEQASPQETGRGDEEEDAGAADGAPKGFSALAGSSWTSEDGGSSLSITPTNLVVTSPEGSSTRSPPRTGASPRRSPSPKP